MSDRAGRTLQGVQRRPVQHAERRRRGLRVDGAGGGGSRGGGFRGGGFGGGGGGRSGGGGGRGFGLSRFEYDASAGAAAVPSGRRQRVDILGVGVDAVGVDDVPTWIDRALDRDGVAAVPAPS